MNSLIKKLSDKIGKRTTKIGIIGMGYIGIPLSLAFSNAGFPITGFDNDNVRIKEINTGKKVMKHISSNSMIRFINNPKNKVTSDLKEVRKLDCVIICVPTPLDESNHPDMSYIVDATNNIFKELSKGQLVILESTTYPGTTRDIVKPILEKNNLKAGKDFFLAYSPEREDPGNKEFNLSKIPKIISGYTDNCLELTKQLYETIVPETILVSSMEAAESTKLLENIFRAVNIAMVNELKLVFDKMGVNIWEVIDAAKTKPFGFMPFYPGPGIGGHCIPVDPFYLSWKAKEFNTEAKFIELAGEINKEMPIHVSKQIEDALRAKKKNIQKSKILVIGLAYKKDIDDIRESPAIKIIDLLTEKGAIIQYHDPFIKKFKNLKSIDLTGPNIKEFDALVIITNHSNINYELIGEQATLVIDTRNVMSYIKKPKARIVMA
jgi:UDP-N-acetyl-D-glucosamine dehydrogenase